MLVPEHVQHAVYDEPRELLAHRDAVLERVRACDGGRDVDVADHRGISTRPLVCERDHVGGAAMAEMPRVEARHGGSAEEGDREHRIAYALRREGGARDRCHARRGEWYSHVLRADVDAHAHTEANSDVTPPLAAG